MLKKAIFVLGLLILPSLAAFATERTLSLALTSNYVFRGETQTNDKAAVQATYLVSQKKDSGFYAGFFTSNVSKGIEVDLFGGIKFSAGKRNQFVIDLGGIEYLFNNREPSASHDFYAAMHYELSYVKYSFAEKDERYLDLGLGFYVLGDAEMIFHFGNLSGPNKARTGNDVSVTLQNKFASTTFGVTATYEDKSVNKNTELFAFISSEF